MILSRKLRKTTRTRLRCDTSGRVFRACSGVGVMSSCMSSCSPTGNRRTLTDVVTTGPSVSTIAARNCISTMMGTFDGTKLSVPMDYNNKCGKGLGALGTGGTRNVVSICVTNLDTMTLGCTVHVVSNRRVSRRAIVSYTFVTASGKCSVNRCSSIPVRLTRRNIGCFRSRPSRLV